MTWIEGSFASVIAHALAHRLLEALAIKYDTDPQYLKGVHLTTQPLLSGMLPKVALYYLSAAALRWA